MTSEKEDFVVLTGCGWVTPSVAGGMQKVMGFLEVNRTLGTGENWFHPVPRSMAESETSLPDSCRRDDHVWVAALAVHHALRSAGISQSAIPAERIGAVVGCAFAPLVGMIDFAEDVRKQSARFVSPLRFPQTVGNYVGGAIARGFDFRGPNSTLACGSASGLIALNDARRFLMEGRADAMLAGGAEKLTEALAMELAGDPGSVSEGACFFVVERRSSADRRGVKWLAAFEDSDAGSESAVVEMAGLQLPVIHSSAGLIQRQSIHIESWIGRCFGASGAAAVAAAIAAARGFVVPMVTKSGDVSEMRFDKPGGETADPQRNLPAVVTASDLDRGIARLGLSIPRA